MRNVFRDWMFATDLGDANVGGFACFGEGVIAAVEILALLQLVLEQVLLVWELSVEAK